MDLSVDQMKDEMVPHMMVTVAEDVLATTTVKLILGLSHNQLRHEPFDARDQLLVVAENVHVLTPFLLLQKGLTAQLAAPVLARRVELYEIRNLSLYQIERVEDLGVRAGP